MKANCYVSVRLAQTADGSTGLYIEDVASGEVIFYAIMPAAVGKQLLTETVTIPAYVTDYSERIGHTVTIQRVPVPDSIIASAIRRKFDVYKAAIEWFTRQPEFNEVHEFEVSHETNNYEIVTRVWEGMELPEEDAEYIVEED